MIGAAIGFLFRDQPILGRWTNADNGTLAGFYIVTLTTLATPLIFFAIIEAFVHTQFTRRQGIKMFAICAVNIAAAFAIGLTILNVFQPGTKWRETFEKHAQQAAKADGAGSLKQGREMASHATGSSLSPLVILKGYVPQSILQPFAENKVLTIAVMAILIGTAMRSLKRGRGGGTAQASDADGGEAGEPAVDLSAAMRTFEAFVVAGYQITLWILRWLIDLAPYAICMAVANTIGMMGLEAIRALGVFIITVVAALLIHSLVYYTLSAWIVGGKSPRVYLGEGLPAILTGLSINSSLATAPLTLDALRRMKVSDASARLSACVGTNFNNDGVTLYEAITALFVAQAIGADFGVWQQIGILLAALVGSMGIAGIPNSGLIILALVLKAAQFSDETIQLVLPLFYGVDVLLGRLRSAVNVMGDLQVAILLDVGEEKGPVVAAASSPT